MQDALISPESLSVLTGAGLVEASGDKPMYVHTTSTIEVETANTIKITLDEGVHIAWNGGRKGEGTVDGTNVVKHAEADIFCMTLDDNGNVSDTPCVPKTVSAEGNEVTITCKSAEKVGSVVLVDYYIEKKSNVKQLEITADKFAGNYYLEGSTLFRDEATGVDLPAEFIIPNGKIQSNFTFSMASSGDPSVFDFVMDAFPGYTKFDKTKKVLATIQIVEDDVATADEARDACTIS